MIYGYLHLENRKDQFWPNLFPFWGNDRFWVTKTRRSHNFRTACSWHLQFGRYMLHNDVKNVLDRAIFNCWASNLDCAHDFKISPPAKQKTPITEIFFLPKFFFTPIFVFFKFFSGTFFFYQIFFFHFCYFFPHLTTFHKWYYVACCNTYSGTIKNS